MINIFEYCTGLTSVSIPNSVTSIGSSAFKGCNITTVISKIENPFTIIGKNNTDSRTFSLDVFNNATLYVPAGTIELYKATEGWKDFLFIEEGTGGTPEPEAEKCATPAIAYANDELSFSCETEDVEFVYDITVNGSASGTGNKVKVATTLTVNVYATKEGYENSDVATKIIQPTYGDLSGDSKVDATDLTKLIDILLGR